MTDEEYLEMNGFTRECESPHEISNSDGARATGVCADIVLDYFKENNEPQL